MESHIAEDNPGNGKEIIQNRELLGRVSHLLFGLIEICTRRQPVSKIKKLEGETDLLFYFEGNEMNFPGQSCMTNRPGQATSARSQEIGSDKRNAIFLSTQGYRPKARACKFLVIPALMMAETLNVLNLSKSNFLKFFSLSRSITRLVFRNPFALTFSTKTDHQNLSYTKVHLFKVANTK